MRTDQLVGVWVDCIERGGRARKFATGYVVAPNRVLTARHVLGQGWSEIIIRPMTGDEERKQDNQDARVIWPAVRPGEAFDERQQDDLDAIVIEWNSAEISGPRVFEPAAFMREVPEGRIDWMANCFPRLVRQSTGAPAKYFDAWGAFNPPNEAARVFPVEKGTVRFPHPADWAGASGAPVFTKDGRQVVGIIKAIYPGTIDHDNTENPLERLVVVAAWHLWAAHGFAESLRSEDGTFDRHVTSVRPRLVRSMHRVLKEIVEASVWRALEEEFGLGERCLPDALVVLCERLAQDPSQVVSLTRVRRDVKGDSPTWRLLTEAEDVLLPWMFSEDEQREFWRKMHESGRVLIERAVTANASAALRMAALDGGRARFVKAGAGVLPQDWPGENSHCFGKIVPGEMSAEAVATRIMCEIAAAAPGIGLARLPGHQDSIMQMIRGTIDSQSAASIVERRREIAGILDRSLSTRRKVSGTSYCVVRPEQTGVSPELLVQAIALIRRDVPSLEFLELTNDSALVANETPLLSILAFRAERYP